MGTFSVLLPIFGVFALGFIGMKLLKIEVKSISTMAIYILSPFLAFQTFYQNPINIDYLYLSIYLLALCLSCIAICYLIGYFKKWDKQNTSGFILASSFMNNGNYGTPLVLLVFGQEGFHYAVILMVLQQLIMCTIGIYVAAQGSQGEQELSPLKEVVKVPIVYGSLLGMALNAMHLTIPTQIETVVDMVAAAAIPIIMIVLGMQLATISFKKIEVGKLSVALLIRLAIAPLIAYVITLFMPVDDVVKQIMILMAAMPTAANTTMYAVQFNAKPDFVSSATLVSTLLSIITLPIILALIL